MGALASFLMGMLGQLVAPLVQWFAKRAATKVVAGAALLTALGAAMVTFNSLVSPLMASMFNTQYGQFIGLAFPPISGSCIAAIMGTWLGIQTYKLQARIIMANNGG